MAVSVLTPLTGLFFVLREFIALLFVISGFTKALDVEARCAVKAYALLPSLTGRAFGVLLPWIELAIGGSLLAGLFPAFTASIGLLVLSSFVIAQISVLLRGLKGVKCGCFGSGSGAESDVSIFTLSRTCGIFLALLAVIAFENPVVPGAGVGWRSASANAFVPVFLTSAYVQIINRAPITFKRAAQKKFASSAESVGAFWLGKLTEVV